MQTITTLIAVALVFVLILLAVATFFIGLYKGRIDVLTYAQNLVQDEDPQRKVELSDEQITELYKQLHPDEVEKPVTTTPDPQDHHIGFKPTSYKS